MFISKTTSGPEIIRRSEHSDNWLLKLAKMAPFELTCVDLNSTGVQDSIGSSHTDLSMSSRMFCPDRRLTGVQNVGESRSVMSEEIPNVLL